MPSILESDMTDACSSTVTGGQDAPGKESPNKPEMLDESSLDTMQADDVVTETMIEEEKKLHEMTVEEENKLLEKSKQDFESMEKEECYKRLQFLLQKSNLYTKYLLERMEKQKEEDRVKEERAVKRQSKREEELRRKEEAAKNGDTTEPTKESVRTRGSRDAQKRSASDGKSCDKLSQESCTEEKSIQEGSKQTKRKASNLDKKSPKRLKAVEGGNDRQSLEASLNVKTGPSDKGTVVNGKGMIGETPALNGESAPGETQHDVDEDLVVPSDWTVDGQKVLDGQPALLTGGVLRQYQVEGLQWMNCLYENGVNGILADEMGLGKTIQCIAAVTHLVSMRVEGPFLVVAPLSTVPNWLSEFQRFSPKIPVMVYHGTKDERVSLRNKICRHHSVTKTVSCFPVVITSYEIAMRDRSAFKGLSWKYLIVDEGHRIKNSQCRLIRELRMYHSTHRLLLTGTPLQNNMAELWSLLNFLLPEIFDDLNSFESWFTVDLLMSENSEKKIVENERQKNILGMLHQILSPFMLRRQKCDVDLLIPPKRELFVYAPLVKEQQELYTAVVNKTIDIIEKRETKMVEKEVEVDAKGRPVRRVKKKVNYEAMLDLNYRDDLDDEEMENWVNGIQEQQKETEVSVKGQNKVPEIAEVRYSINNVVMHLRKVCMHPYLIHYPLTSSGDYKIDKDLLKKSGKFLVLGRLLAELKKRGHKVLIFSQMTRMLNILEDMCYLKDYKYTRLDGSSSMTDRKTMMHDFNTDPEIFLFLLSTRAGGLGINLTAADTVIIFDSDWNPQVDLQAQDRCHRIGQTKPVLVLRLVTPHSIDEQLIERAAAKRKLEKMVIHKGKFKTGLTGLQSPSGVSTHELLELLKSKDHETTYGSRGHVISNRDLDKLLDRSDLWHQWQMQKDSENGKESQKSVVPKSNVIDVEGVFKVVNSISQPIA